MHDYVLILYYSKTGATQKMAHLIADGVESVGLTAKIRTVPNITSCTQPLAASIPEHGDLYCSLDDLANCAALAVGSPTRFGNMASELKYFWDQTTPLWLSGALHDKPASVFTSSGAMHGGNETTLWSMLPPLFHHGMMILGLPNAHAALSHTRTGGTPYGASHVSGAKHEYDLSDDEKKLCIAQGKRLAELVLKLKSNNTL
ncbi:MAG: NAD(P)H:quinone oxidoreductase [Acinetobacter sp.]|nr:NAD(P)H:quinone oxidoreductase [Acinetobacter sp.]